MLTINCIKSEREACKKDISLQEADLDTCYSSINILLQIDQTNQKTKDLFDSYFLMKCSQAIINERECNEKSLFIPVIHD